jgi:hypothetical protein
MPTSERLNQSEGEKGKGSLVDCKPGKVFAPDPANLLFRVVLISGEPKLTVFADHIEDLNSRVSKSGGKCRAKLQTSPA